MLYRKKKMLLYICFLANIFLFGHHASAETFEEEQSDPNTSYAVTPLLPKNQQDSSQMYFDLRVSPGEEQTISIKITNESTKDMDYIISINQASTSKSGNIDYSNASPAMHESLQYDIASLVDFEPNIHVPANSSQTVPIKLTIPKEEFSGIILGGIYVEINDEMNQEKVESGIKSRASYVIALLLSEKDNELEPNIQFDSVYPARSFGETSIVAKLINPVMSGYGGLSYDSKIKDKKNNKIIASKKYENKEFAPNSLYEHVIDLDNKPLVAGEYELNLIVTDKKDHKWVFTEPFTISKKQAKGINSISIDGWKESNLILFSIAGMVLAVLLGIVFFIWKIKKREDSNES